jgi:hypothetical protein
MQCYSMKYNLNYLDNDHYTVVMIKPEYSYRQRKTAGNGIRQMAYDEQEFPRMVSVRRSVAPKLTFSADQRSDLLCHRRSPPGSGFLQAFCRLHPRQPSLQLTYARINPFRCKCSSIASTSWGVVPRRLARSPVSRVPPARISLTSCSSIVTNPPPPPGDRPRRRQRLRSAAGGQY